METFIPINRTILGARRAALLFQGCRYAAHRLDPDCQINAVYQDHERVGWRFTMRNRLAVARLHLCYEALKQGRPLAGLLP